MTALAAERGQKPFTIKKIKLKMGAAYKAWKGGIACFDTAAAGYVVQGKASTTLTRIGVFAETVDNGSGAAGDLSVTVYLDKEIQLQGFANDTGTPVAQANIGATAYILDDHTLTGDATGHSSGGRPWKIDGTTVYVELNTL